MHLIRPHEGSPRSIHVNQLNILEEHGYTCLRVGHEGSCAELSLSQLPKEMDERNGWALKPFSALQFTPNLFVVLYVPDVLSERYLEAVELAARCGCSGCQTAMDDDDDNDYLIKFLKKQKPWPCQSKNP